MSYEEIFLVVGGFFYDLGTFLVNYGIAVVMGMCLVGFLWMKYGE